MHTLTTADIVDGTLVEKAADNAIERARQKIGSPLTVSDVKKFVPRDPQTHCHDRDVLIEVRKRLARDDR